MSVVARVTNSAVGKVKELSAYVDGMYAYTYGFPLVMMDVTKSVLTAAPKSGEYSAPINQFHRIRELISPDWKNVVRISRNSLWSTAYLDLRDEPMVFSHPDTRGRYMVAQVMNMWTDDFASMGIRTTGGEAGSFLIAGPGWNGTVPADVRETYRCSTRFAWVLVQLSSVGPEDYAEIHQLQDDLKITPLSRWGQPYSPPEDVPVDPAVDTTATPFDQVRLMDGPTYFRRFSAALKDNPPYPADKPMLRKLKRLGIQPGHEFETGDLDPATAKGLTRAARRVWGTLEAAPYSIKTVNGWLLPVNLGRYGTDYDTRAFITYVGLGALTAEDCVYPTAFVDGDGNRLEGTGRYVIHFEHDRLFPSHSGVWSISAYREQFYVHNPIERYGITSAMPLKYNTDGSLDIYIQARSPGEDREPNWLPCPPGGPFNVTARVYQPEHAMYDGRVEHGVVVEAGTYSTPPIRRVG